MFSFRAAKPPTSSLSIIVIIPCRVSSELAALIVIVPVNVVPTWNSYVNPAVAAGKVTVIPPALLRLKIVPDSAAVTVLVESVILVTAALIVVRVIGVSYTSTPSCLVAVADIICLLYKTFQTFCSLFFRC